MSKLLTLEECKTLAKQGLPQELKAGDWYYQRGLKNGSPNWVAFLHDTNRLLYSHERYKIPDLETLMEFARGVTNKLKPHPDSGGEICSWWIAAGHPPPHKHGWYLTVDTDIPGPNVFMAEHAIQTVVQLLRKVNS